MPPTESLIRVAPLTWPRQHGAWTIAAACLLAGTGVAGRTSVSLLLLAAAVVAGFCARHAFVLQRRMSDSDDRRAPARFLAAAYGALFAALGTFLLLQTRLWGLLGFGGIAGLLVLAGLGRGRRNLDLTLRGEILGVVSLTLLAPAAHYCATETLSIETISVWLLTLLFFAGRPLQVRFYSRRPACVRELPERLAAGAPSLAYHISALAAAALLALASGVLPPGAPLVLLPASAGAILAVTRRLDRRPRIALVGGLECLQTSVFVALLVLAHLP